MECKQDAQLFVPWKRGLIWTLARCFVLSIKVSASFNVLCFLIFFSECWHSTMFQILGDKAYGFVYQSSTALRHITQAPDPSPVTPLLYPLPCDPSSVSLPLWPPFVSLPLWPLSSVTPPLWPLSCTHLDETAGGHNDGFGYHGTAVRTLSLKTGTISSVTCFQG